MTSSNDISSAAAFEVRGFTIVELLVTVTLAAILLSIAVPSFRQLMVSNRLTAQANEIVAAINFARSEAVKRNGNVTFCRANADADNICSTTTDIWQFWIVRAANGTVIRRGSISTFSNTLRTRSNLTTDQLVLGADGLARTNGVLVNNQQITFCATNIAASEKNLRRITLAAGSRMYTETPTPGETCT